MGNKRIMGLRGWPLVATSALAASSIALGAFQVCGFSIALNATESIPGTVFLVQKGRLPNRNELVVFRAPHNGIYNMDFIKIAKGVPGDIVMRNRAIVTVNGEVIGPVQKATTDGKPLAPGPVGIVPQGSYYVAGLNERSYDSRYANIGFVPARDVIGRAIAIF